MVLDKLVLALIIVGAILYAHSDERLPPCESWVGKVVSLNGSVENKKQNQLEWQSVRINAIYCPGDVIRTLETGQATILLQNHSHLELEPWTTLTFSNPAQSNLPWLRCLFKSFIGFLQCKPLQHNTDALFINAAFFGSVWQDRIKQKRWSYS